MGCQAGGVLAGLKLHVSETCDDPPPCTCRPAAAREPAAEGREHDKDCAHLTSPNLITHVATTDATVTDHQMTGAIHASLAGKKLAPGRHYLDFRLPQRRGRGLGADDLGHRADRAAARRHLRAGPASLHRLRPRRLHRQLRHQDRHLPARKDIGVLDAMHPARQGRHRGHLLRRRLRPLPGPRPVHHQREEPAAAHRAAPRPAPRRKPPACAAETTVPFPG